MKFRKVLGVFPMKPGSGWRFRVMVELSRGRGDPVLPGVPVADVLCGDGKLEVGSVGVAGTREYTRPARSPRGVVPAVRAYLDRKGIIL